MFQFASYCFTSFQIATPGNLSRFYFVLYQRNKKPKPKEMKTDPISTTTTTVAKAFSWKNAVTALLITVAVVLILSYVIRLDLVTTDTDGNIVKNEIKPSFRKLTKQVAA